MIILGSFVIGLAAIMTAGVLDHLAPARSAWVDIIAAIVIYLTFLSVFTRDVTRARVRRSRKDQ